MKPFISFIICTYNSPELISRCLTSILKQRYSGKKEIIIVDGGSDRNTLDLLDSFKKKYKEIRILNNKNKLPEGFGMGKWLGWKNSKGKYIFIIDQDNELQGTDFVEKMIKPLKEKKVFGSIARLKVYHEDSLTNQYIALVGTDPFFAYRSLDFNINFKNIDEVEEYLLYEIDKENIIITGGNCFVYKKDILDNQGGYIQDTENITKLVKAGYNQVAINKNAFTHHLATKGFFDFIKKKKKWAKAYRIKKTEKEVNFSYIPRNKIERKYFLINLFFIITILPNVFISFKKLIQTKEKAWLLHPFLTFITSFIYLFYSVISFASLES